MAEKNGGDKARHHLELMGRELLSVGGVVDVDSYDEHTVTVQTVCGILCIEGEGLHVRSLALENGTLSVEGRIGGLYYTDDSIPKSGGFLARLFK